MKKLTLRDLYPSFAHLIWETVLIEGTVTAMADKIGIDGATIGKWLRRRSKHPEEALLRKLVRSYPDLGDVNGVIELIQRDALREIMGQPIPAPDLRGLQRGPKAQPPKRRRGIRVLGWLVAAAISTTAWGPTPASASASAIGSEPTAATTYYVKRRRRGYSLWGRGNPDPLRSGYPRLTACAA